MKVYNILTMLALVFVLCIIQASASITFVAPSPTNGSVVTQNIQTLNVSITNSGVVDFYYLINDNTDGTQYLIPPTLTNYTQSFYIGAGINNIQAVAKLSNGTILIQNLTFTYGNPVFNSTYTDISSCPYSILNSGNYRLTNNLNSTATCITVLISNVNLDLNGKNIFYSNAGSHGVDVSAKSNVTIQNGSGTSNASSDFVYYNNNNNNNNMSLTNLVFNGSGAGYLANLIEVNTLTAQGIDGYNLIRVGMASTNINLTNIRSSGLITTSGNTYISNASFGSLVLLDGNLYLTDILNSSATYSFSSLATFFFNDSTTKNNITLTPASSSGILADDLQFNDKGLVALHSFNTFLDAWVNISNTNNLYLWARNGYVPINQYGDIDVFNLTAISGYTHITAASGGNLSIVSSPFCPNTIVDNNYAIDCSWRCTLKDNINVSNYGFYFYNNGSAIFQNVSIVAKTFSNRYVNVGYDVLQPNNQSEISLSSTQTWTQNFNFTWWQNDAPYTTGIKNIIFGGTDPTTPYTSLEERYYSPSNFSLVFHTHSTETFCSLASVNTSGWHNYSFSVLGTTAYAGVDGNAISCTGTVNSARDDFSLLFSPMYQCSGTVCLLHIYYTEALQNRVFGFKFYNSSTEQFDFRITKWKGVNQVDAVSNSLTISGLSSSNIGINSLNKEPLDYAVCQVNATAGTNIRGLI